MYKIKLGGGARLFLMDFKELSFCCPRGACFITLQKKSISQLQESLKIETEALIFIIKVLKIVLYQKASLKLTVTSLFRNTYISTNKIFIRAF